MSRMKILFLSIIVILVLGLSSCSGSPAQATLAPTATEHAYPPPMYDPEEVAASLTAIPQEEAVAVATQAPETEPTEEVVAEPQVDYCFDCHTDQQALIDTADPIAEVVSENEGQG